MRGETCRAFERLEPSDSSWGGLQPHGPLHTLRGFIGGMLLAPDVDQRARNQSARGPTAGDDGKVRHLALLGGGASVADGLQTLWHRPPHHDIVKC